MWLRHQIQNANVEQQAQNKNSDGSTPQKSFKVLAETQQASNAGPTVVPGSVRVERIKYLDRIPTGTGVMEPKLESGKAFAWIVLKVAKKLRGFGSSPITALSQKGVEYPLVGFGFSERTPNSPFSPQNVMDLDPGTVTLTFVIDAGSKITQIRGIGTPIDIPPDRSKK